MILVEVGNTTVIAARDNSGHLSPLFKVNSEDNDKLHREITRLNENELLLLSSVRKDLTTIILESGNRQVIRVLQYNNLGKISVDYETPETLGIDRVLACAGGVSHAQSDVVVIDAGTACTVDFMTAGYTFTGGVILPGLPMLRHSMRTLTPELPEVDSQIPAQFPGRSTRDAIRIGLNEGFIHAISRFIEQYLERINDAQIMITGGDGLFVKQQLHERYGSVYHENLVFDGMLAWKDLNNIDI